jgi:hypothetical protein
MAVPVETWPLSCAAELVFSVMKKRSNMPTDADFYVATDGEDGNFGTEEKPFATLARARDAVRQLRKAGVERDVVVLIRGGSYQLYETVVFGLEDSAPEGCATIYAAFPGERPVLSAGAPVEGWKKREDGIWEAELPAGIESVNSLYDREGMLPRARGRGFVPEGEGTRWTMHYPEGVVADDLDVENAELVIVPHYPWAMNVLPIAAVDPKTRTLEVTVPGTYPLDQPTFGHFPEGSAWIENILAVLSEPGEWCVDKQAGKLYLMPRGEEPGGILAPALTELVRIEGRMDGAGGEDEPVRNQVFRGLTFAHGDRWNWEREKTGWGLQHDWEMFDRPTAMVRLRGAEGCTVEGCRFAHAGSTGIRLDLHCRGNRIEGNRIEHIGGVGILLAGYGPGTKDVNRENEVVGNQVHHVGRLLWSSPGIFVWQSGGNRVAHNLVHHTAYTALVVSGRIVWKRDGEAECARTIRWEEVDRIFPERPERLSWHQREQFLHGRENIIGFNEVHHAMQILGDGNCVYISGTGGGNVVRNNFLHDVDSYNMNASIRCDDDQHDTAIESNVVFRNCGEGFISKGNNRVVNNIFADIRSRTLEGIENKHQRGYIVFPYGEPHGSLIQRNIFVSREAGQQIITHGPGRQGGGYLWDCEANANLYWNTEDPKWAEEFLEEMRERGVEIRSIAADPGFADLDSGDFRLLEDAAAKEIGFVEIDLSRVGSGSRP